MTEAEEYYNEWFFVDTDIPLSDAERKVIECMEAYAEKRSIEFSRYMFRQDDNGRFVKKAKSAPEWYDEFLNEIKYEK